MAEDNVEKKRTNTWPWIVAALVGALLIGMFLAPDDQDVGGETGAFLAFVEGDEPTPQVSSAHQYTSEGITRLANAIEERLQDADAQDAEVDARVEEMRQQASALQAEPNAGTHAAMAREALVTGADLIATLNPGAAAEVSQAARAIQPEVPLLQQTAQVRHFFDRAGVALSTGEPVPVE